MYIKLTEFIDCSILIPNPLFIFTKIGYFLFNLIIIKNTTNHFIIYNYFPYNKYSKLKINFLSSFPSFSQIK